MESETVHEEDSGELSENLEESTTTSKAFVFQYTDLAINVEGKRFYVNKEVLKNVSPVFKAMLEGNFKEKHQEEITLPGKSRSDFKLFLKIVYLRKYEKLTVRNAIRIYPLTHEYQAPITQQCKELMKKCVSNRSYPISSICDFVGCIFIAERYQLKDILDEAITTAAHITQRVLLDYPEYKTLKEETRFKIAQTRVTLLEPHTRVAQNTIENLQDQLQNAERHIESIKAICEKQKYAIILPHYWKRSHESTTVNMFLELPKQFVKDNSESDSDSNDSDSYDKLS